MFYVTMTDKFLSGWRCMNGKKDKLVVICENVQEAEQIFRAAQRRPEMKYINILTKCPRYSSKRYIVSFKKFSELSGSWKQ